MRIPTGGHDRLSGNGEGNGTRTKRADCDADGAECPRPLDDFERVAACLHVGAKAGAAIDDLGERVERRLFDLS
jgi:hypothetical protein